MVILLLWSGNDTCGINFHCRQFQYILDDEYEVKPGEESIMALTSLKRYSIHLKSAIKFQPFVHHYKSYLHVDINV